ncbi:response regulator transcription factor [Ottowia thiooxydans]|uniref:response regulator transcription factor n=1 Tax=Ottowia thiooxydans TaxID=219182 RepID=UPI00041FF759|nr:response regulator transcription factor [Ottowia thiooxydans]
MPSESLVTPDRPQLLIVDDHELVRLGLSSLIASQAAGHDQPGTLEASTLAEAIDLYALHQDSLALILLDLHLPDAHGLSGLRQLLARFPAAPVAVLSGDADPALKRQALEIGARAYLPKSGQLADVITYLRAQGLLGLPTSAGATAGMAQPEGQVSEAARMVQTRDGERVRLTHRQAEMLDWVLAGQSNREIAETAHLSEGTVKNHVSALLLMFGVRSRAQLISRLR